MANKLPSPTPAEILALRQAAGLTQAQAAARVYASSYRTWQDWELGVRTMPVAIWELWKLQDNLNEKTTLTLDDLKNRKGTESAPLDLKIEIYKIAD